MEQIATKKYQEYNPHPSYGCFQVESKEKHSLECHECFQITQKWTLSKLTFLVSLKMDADAIEKFTCSFKLANGCKDFQLMPKIMRDYAANFGIVYLGLTKLPMEAESVDDTGKHASAPVENFFVVKWKENVSEDSGEDAAFAKCVLCLTSKRKVALISIIQRYVWVVDSKKSVNCKECDGKVFHGAQFSCNQYLRQVPVLKARNYIDVSLKRKRQSSES